MTVWRIVEGSQSSSTSISAKAAYNNHRRQHRHLDKSRSIVMRHRDARIDSNDSGVARVVKEWVE